MSTGSQGEYEMTECEKCEQETPDEELEHCDGCGWQLCEACHTDDECREEDD